jgi:phosphodiesterase/alkaline phosphatase D-like protein
LPSPGYTGTFTVEIAAEGDYNFDNILYSATTDYVTGQLVYSVAVSITNASVGDVYLYRVKNQRNYTPIIGEIITSVAYSDIVEIEIGSLQIN